MSEEEATSSYAQHWTDEQAPGDDGGYGGGGEYVESAYGDSGAVGFGGPSLVESEVVNPATTVKLFNKWKVEQVNIPDNSLIDYISVHGSAAKLLPHNCGRYQQKRFRKAKCPIVERLVCSLMFHGRNAGKKMKAIRIVKHSFEIIHLLTGENPVQVLVLAVVNSGPCEDSTRVGRAGTVRRQAVDVSPLRRVNQALYLLCTGQ